jgi:transcriptional regulator with XRE-family HTH domain
MTLNFEVLAQEREARNIGVRELARRLGRNHKTLSGWENGEYSPSNFIDFLNWCKELDQNPFEIAEIKPWWTEEHGRSEML